MWKISEKAKPVLAIVSYYVDSFLNLQHWHCWDPDIELQGGSGWRLSRRGPFWRQETLPWPTGLSICPWNQGLGNLIGLVKISQWRAVCFQDRVARTRLSPWLTQLKKKVNIWNSGFQDVGQKTMKDSNPWEMENKQCEPCDDRWAADQNIC